MVCGCQSLDNATPAYQEDRSALRMQWATVPPLCRL